jgi:hypothetical protein
VGEPFGSHFETNVLRAKLAVVSQGLQSRSAPSTRIGSRPLNVEEIVRELAEIRIGTDTAFGGVIVD